MNKTSSAIVRTLLLGTSCLSVFAVGLDAARAQPTGGTVALGQATITNHGANSTVIDQTTGKAIINWDSFSIAAGGTVKFNQPGTSSITLNRVTGSESSAIYGSLLANGQVWLINGNGILFGGGSKINVGGLIATTSDIADGDFASGNYNFGGGTGASVVNQGTIHTARGGSAVLSGASVSNQGLIQADTGTVVLGGASAFTVDFDGDNLIRYQITGPAATATNGQTGVSNSGTLASAGGHVIMTARAASSVQDAVVNNTGMISATSAKVQNGEVVLDAGDGTVDAGGTIDASGTGAGQTGGTVAITGRTVTVADNTQINVSGDAGGGTVNIGGSLHGTGPLQNASTTTVGHATIRADAIRKGNGGTLVVWSNGLTDFSGIFSAKGGAAGGDGGFAETSGATLHIAPEAKVDTTAPKGQTGTWLLDPDNIVISSGEGTNTQLNNGVLGVGTDPGASDQVTPATIIAALSSTNVTLEAAEDIDVDSAVIYGSVHTLSLLAQQDINVQASIQNTLASGGGNINLIAGWDGVTVPPASLTTSGAYGNNDGTVSIGGRLGDVAVGAASGTTTVATSDLVIESDNNNAQLGFHGAGGGDINVLAAGDVSVESVTGTAQIGNGSLTGDVTGNVTGNISVRSAGDFTLTSGEGNGSNWIGNFTGGTATETGNVTLIGTEGDVGANFGANISADLAGGDFTLGQSGNGESDIDGGFVYSSPHTLTLLSGGDLVIDGTVTNNGTGAMTLVAGWDGVSLTPSQLAASGAYGNNNGTITIGGDNAPGDVSVGAAHGTLTVFAANLTLSPVNGYAQLGYHGAGGGDIDVTVTQNITGIGNGTDDFALQLGNGTLANDVTGNVTGNIDLNAGNQTVFFSQTGEGWLGNSASSGFTESGNVTSVSVNGSYSADYMEADLGTTATTGGDLFLGFNNPGGIGFRIGGIEYTSPHSLVFATGASLDVTGSVINHGTGDVTLVAGWDGTTIGTGAQILAAGAYGLNGTTMNVGGDHSYTIGNFSFSNDQFEDISVGSAGGLTSILTGGLTVSPASGFYAQIGYHGTGGGNISVAARGDLTMTAGTDAHDYAMIGNGSLNGDVDGAITGNIIISVGGTTSLNSTPGTSEVWLGNVANTGSAETGNVLLTSFDIDNVDQLAAMVGSDLVGGDVTIGVTDASATNEIGGSLSYNSAHTLNLLTAGSVTFDSSIQNAGSGAINIVAGWNGTTLDPAHFGDAGVFGNNNGAILIGGADATGDVAVGSAGGATSLYTDTVTLSALNGAVQVGFHGAATGAILVDALGSVTLGGGASSALTAEIGSGATLGSNTGSGNVTVDAGTIVVQNNAAIAAAALTLDLSAISGTVGTITAPLDIASNSLSLQTGGEGLVLASPNNGVSLVGSANLNGGTLVISAGGPVTQSVALNVGALNVSTTSGAITLTNTGNAVAGLVTLASPGAVSLYDVDSIVLNTAGVGGDLTLLSKGNVTFTSSVQDTAGNVTVVAGWDGSTTTASSFGNAGVYGNNNGSVTIGGTGASGNVAVGSQSGTTSLYAASFNVTATNGYAQLGYHGSGGGAIKVAALHDMTVTAGAGNAMIGNGSLGTDVTGNVTGDIDVRLGGNAIFNSGPSTQGWFGDVARSGTETGNVIFLMNGQNGSQSGALNNFLAADIVGGDFTLGFTGTGDQGPGAAIAYNSSHTLNTLAAGNFVLANSVQNAGTGAINVVAGWDGHTLTPSSFGTAGVFGNNGKGVTIGGTGASGNVAIGSAGGTTSIYGTSLALTAANGYAQLGFNGHGTGAIVVDVSGAVNLTGGAAAGDFAQLGNGGLRTNGNNNGNITVTAGGDVVLTGGAGTEAYAQIGQGGAESNTGATGGYSNVATIAVTAADVLLNAGGGSAAYVQIGNGGYKSGLNLAGGTATNGGDITVTASHTVSLTGNGADAYAQIGNGGSQSNLNAAASAGGIDSGDIVVSAPNGPSGTVTLAAGAGADAYAQIGNGGYDINTGTTATLANFTVSGDISVTDLSLTGGNSGGNAYSQIGNGDASQNGTANISGDITIDANGQITSTNGTALHSPALIGNATGLGTVTGSVTGAPPPASAVTTDPAVLGVVVTNTANNGSPGTDVPPIATVVVTNTEEGNGGAAAVGASLQQSTPGPLASLDNGGDSSAPNTSDSATVVIADSLNGALKAASSQTILAGMLKQTLPGNNTVHGVPPADQDFSSWGNEAFWQ